MEPSTTNMPNTTNTNTTNATVASPTTGGDNQQKSGKKGWQIATVIASILAICGIGFGIYGMLTSSQKDSQISDLKTQVEEKGKIAEAEVPVKETTTANETTTIVDTAKANSGPYIENGYFYVPRWGAKYKLSDNLTNYGYAVDQENQGDSYGNYVVGLTAISKNDYIDSPQTTYYNDIFSCSVVTIRAMEDSKKSWQGNATPDVQFNGFNFIIHDTWRAQNCTSGYSASTDTVAEQLKAILSKPESI